MRANDLCRFISERESIRLRKEAGLPRAKWTNDEILGMYRFCNVRRNDDKVSRWVHCNWLIFQPAVFEDNLEDLWFAMVVARLFNLPSTLAAIEKTVLPFKPAAMKKILTRLGKVFNAAYIVSTNGIAMGKVDYVVDNILTPLWNDRARLRPTANDTLDSWHMTLCQYRGLGSFMAAQVVADMKYVEPLHSAADWQWWAASGPGSRRGLGRVMFDDVEHHYNETHWRSDFIMLWKEANAKLKWFEPLTGQDLQNCLCEFDKYERARLGEGRPKQLYKEGM